MQRLGSRGAGRHAVRWRRARSTTTASGAAGQGVSRRLVGLVGRADAGIAKRLACLRGADGWKAYLAALEECDESWRDEGFGWSVLGAQRSYVQTIAKAGPIARSESWIGLPPTSTAMLLGLDNSDGTWGLLGSMGRGGDREAGVHKVSRAGRPTRPEAAAAVRGSRNPGR